MLNLHRSLFKVRHKTAVNIEVCPLAYKCPVFSVGAPQMSFSSSICIESHTDWLHISSISEHSDERRVKLPVRGTSPTGNFKIFLTQPRAGMLDNYFPFLLWLIIRHIWYERLENILEQDKELRGQYFSNWWDWWWYPLDAWKVQYTIRVVVLKAATKTWFAFSNLMMRQSFNMMTGCIMSANEDGYHWYRHGNWCPNIYMYKTAKF